MEKLIRKRLLLNRDLCRILAGLDNEPAIFYAKAPDDVAMEINYPQVILSSEKFTDAIHGVAGLLTIEIICTQATLTPEPIEKLIRQSLEGVFFHGKEIFLLKWAKSETYTEPSSEHLAAVIGMEVTFEIREFPCAETSTPDAIQGLNDWAKEVFVVGKSDFDDFFVPTREKPAVYFEATAEKMTGQQAAVAWVEAQVRGHVFAPTVRARREWLTILNRKLMTLKAIPLGDGTPLRIVGTEADFTADELSGQLKITCDFGVPRAHVKTIPINRREYDWSSELRWQNVHD